VPKQLTTQNATITTAAVEVKTLTISGKQVTLAVFRQLKEEPLIADDGTLNGVPWGTVNYHPDKCGDQERRHWHIVWQQGQELRRSRVDEKPRFDEAGYRFRSAATDAYAAYLLGEWVHGRIDWCPLREDKLDPRSFRTGHFCRWKRHGVNVEGLVQEHVQPYTIQLAEVTKARLFTQEKRYSEVPEGSQLRQLEVYREDLAKVSAALDAELSALPTPEEVRNAHDTEIAAEQARRHRHRDVHATLAQLPQLFIAV
jgi:hypothetical protein